MFTIVCWYVVGLELWLGLDLVSGCYAPVFVLLYVVALPL